jgi:ABC-type glutathione transport system ATPase component
VPQTRPRRLRRTDHRARCDHPDRRAAAIKEAIRDTGVGALYITHDLAVVAQVADEIMVLRHGKHGRAWGDDRQIINEPREEYTRALVSVRSHRAPRKAHGRYAGSEGRKRDGAL